MLCSSQPKTFQVIKSSDNMYYSVLIIIISETITKCLYEYYINVPFNRLYLILAALLLQAALYMSATTNSLNIYILTYGLLGGTTLLF